VAFVILPEAMPFYDHWRLSLGPSLLGKANGPQEYQKVVRELKFLWIAGSILPMSITVIQVYLVLLLTKLFKRSRDSQGQPSDP
jgi:hypothetical protein